MLLNDEKGGTMFFQEGAKLSPPTAWMLHLLSLGHARASPIVC